MAAHPLVYWIALLLIIPLTFFGVRALWDMYSTRKDFHMAARSPRLILVSGTMFLVTIIWILAVESLQGILGIKAGPIGPLSYKTRGGKWGLIGFGKATCPLLLGPYLIRTLSLVVRFSPRLRKRVPGVLLKEKNAVIFLLSLALFVYTPIALFDPTNAPLIAFMHMLPLPFLLALLPKLSKIEDIYHLSREIRIVVILQTLLIFIDGYVNSAGLDQSVSVSIAVPLYMVVFYLSNVLPVRNRHPGHVCALPFSCLRGGWMRLHGQKVLAEEESTLNLEEMEWSYRMIRDIPALAACFKEYAFKALCDESVIFLDSVEEYGGLPYWPSSTEEVDGKPPEGALDAESSQVLLEKVQKIMDVHIRSNSSYEVNIPDKQRKAILKSSDQEAFMSASLKEKKEIFAIPYHEVDAMLQVNLFNGFQQTSAFKEKAESCKSEIKAWLAAEKEAEAVAAEP
ncbi:unnamed protein product [Chrysoparadoxa australica]